MKNNTEMLRGDIVEIRNAIRIHRNAKGDDRCWLDDYIVWGMLKNAPEIPNLTLEEKMQKCTDFYELRRSETADNVPFDSITDPALWDGDLIAKCAYQLFDEQNKLVLFLDAHRLKSVIGKLTIEDDRRLYSVLPEKLPADFRLPDREEFLGRAKLGAGCPNFWDSHASCGAKCNLHRWGPCPE